MRCVTPAFGCSRSIRWRWIATATAIGCRGPSPMRSTHWCWRTCSAPTPAGIVRSRPTRSRRWWCRCWPGPAGRGPGGCRQTARLRSQLREFYPSALQAFPDLTTKTALTVLSAAPTPGQALGLTVDDLHALARSCGRWGITLGEVARLHQVLHQPQLRQPVPVEQAMGTVVLQLVLGLRILNLTIHRLETELAEQLDRHGDTAILRSLPGVGVVLAGRMLSEFGDDPARFTNVASRRDYAGTAPITKASGKGRVVLMRRIRKTRLFDTCRDWSFSAVNASPGARAVYQHRRELGDGHEKALRRVGNKLVGQLDHCLRHHGLYREETAWTLTA